LTNSIVTLDAMGCQKVIAGRILERGADYLLVLKANHGTAFTAVQEHCDQHCFARGATAKPVFDTFDDSHGRLVRRRVFVCPEAATLEALDTWPGLRPVLAVESIRGVKGSGTVEAEIRYVLSSCGDDPTQGQRMKPSNSQDRNHTCVQGQRMKGSGPLHRNLGPI
jgi:hypothetical protein